MYIYIMINGGPHLRDGNKLKRSNFRITLRFQDPQISLGARRQACSKRPKCRRPRSPPPRPQRTLAEGMDFPSIGSCMCCMYCIGTFHHCISLKETLQNQQPIVIIEVSSSTHEQGPNFCQSLSSWPFGINHPWPFLHWKSSSLWDQ